MQRQHLGILVGVAVAVATVGCVPATYVQVPALRGRVVGPHDQPIANAVVHVVRDSDDVEVVAVPAAADGTFSRPEQGAFFFQFAGADAVVTTYSVSAAANGRRSPTTQVTSDVRRFYDPSTDRDLGNLRLP